MVGMRRARMATWRASGMALSLSCLTSLLLASATHPGWAAAADAAAAVEACQDESRASAERITDCTKLVTDPAQPPEVRAEALIGRGVAYDAEGKLDPAIADFTEALRLSPNDHSAYIYRGNAYDAKGDRDRAIADYTEAIRLNPEDAAGYYNRGGSYQEKGDKEKAAADFRKVLEIDPKDTSAKEGLDEVTRK